MKCECNAYYTDLLFSVPALIKLALILFGSCSFSQQTYQLTKHLIIFAPDIGAKIDARQIIFVDIIRERGFFQHRIKCFFQPLDTILIRRKNTKIFLLPRNQPAWIDDYTDKAGVFTVPSIVILQPDADTRICISRTDMSIMPIVRIDPASAIFLLLCIQLLFAFFPLGFAELHRKLEGVDGETVRF